MLELKTVYPLHALLAEGTLALYAAETWTLTQRDRRLEAFEMWI